MAESDWAEFTSNVLGSGNVARGVSSAYTEPNATGTNDYVFGFRSLDSTSTGVAGYYLNVTNFNPTASGKGGIMQVAMKKYSGSTGYAPFFGLMLDKDPTANGYFLCLTEGTTYQIGLKKGTPSGGFASSDSGMLRLSTDTYTYSGDGNGKDDWFHLQLGVLVNPHGDVILSASRNDLNTYDVDTTATFTAIDGMADYIDDSLGALTGTQPYTTTFYFVYGMYVANTSGCLALYDHITAARQTSP